MNRRTQIGLILVITLILLLGLTVPSLAKKTPDYVVEYYFDDVDWDNLSGVGTYTLYNGNVSRPGWVEVWWLRTPGMKQGEMHFHDEDGESGFVVQFTMSLTRQYNDEPSCGLGSYIVLIDEGTGDFTGIYSSGIVDMCRVDTDIEGTLEGLTTNYQNNKE